MQFLKDWFDPGLLIAGQTQLPGQHVQLLFDCRHIALRGVLAAPIFINATRSGSSLLRGCGQCNPNIVASAIKRKRFIVFISLVTCGCVISFAM